MAALEHLLAKGYFPQELPPPFNTRSFASFAGGAVPAHFELDTRRLRGNILTRPASHNLARAGTLRRELCIPNPINQYQLSRVVVGSWRAIKSACLLSSLSLTTPRYSTKRSRAISREHSFDVLPKARAHSRAGARYIVNADLNQFYGGIYTHSIPWALHTKAVAKSRRNDFTLVGNVLDLALRNGQDQQTIGIPIGPDTSLAIAEVLLSSLDPKLTAAIGVRGHRYIDDYEFGFQTLAQAEAAIGFLQETMGTLELQLNPRKTKILELPASLEAFWIPHLRLFRFRRADGTQQTDVLGYFGRAFELASAHREEPILRYGLRRMRSERITGSNWALYEDLLMQCASVEPGTMPEVVNELYKYQPSRNLDRDKIRHTFETLIQRHSVQGHGSEVCWAIWGLTTLGIGFSGSLIEHAARTRDSAVGLCTLDAHAKGLIHGAVDLSPWVPLLVADELYGENWLLAYEANVKGWLAAAPGVGDYVTADRYFGPLKAAAVSFYETAATLPTKRLIRKTQPQPQPQPHLQPQPQLQPQPEAQAQPQPLLQPQPEPDIAPVPSDGSGADPTEPTPDYETSPDDVEDFEEVDDSEEDEPEEDESETGY